MGRAAAACRAATDRIVFVGIVDEERRDLERGPAVDAAGGVVRGLEEVGGSRQVAQRQLEEEIFAGAAGTGERRDLLVVGVALADGVLEDGRVRGQAGDRELADVARERPVVEHLPGDVVEPQALAEGLQLSGVGVHECLLEGAEPRREVELEQVADAVDADVGRGVAGDVRRVVRVVALARKDGDEARAEDLLHRRQDALLVVDHRVAARRIAALHVVEHPLLVDEDQDASLDRVPEPERCTLRGWKTTSPSDRMTVGPSRPRRATTSSAPG